MAKGETKKTNQMLDTQYQTQQQQGATAYNQNQQDQAGARGRAGDAYGTMMSGYKDFATNGGLDVDRLRGLMGAGGSGAYVPNFDAGKYGEVQGAYRKGMEGSDTYHEFAKTGGWDDGARKGINDLTSQYETIGKKGATTDESANRMRGLGVYDEFAKTGGFSDGDVANIRQRGNSVIPSMYGSMRADAARQGAVQGGYGPGQGALMARMGRQQASAAQGAALDTELGIKQQVNAGRQWGASGASSSEGNILQNQLAGLGGATSNRFGLQDRINSGRLAGQGGLDNEMMWGTSGLEGIADKENSARSSAAGANAARGNANFGQELALENAVNSNRFAGLGGIGDLYTSRPGEVQQQQDYDLASRGLTNGSQSNLIGSRYQANPQRDWLSTIGGIVGAGAGMATGFGNLGFGRAAKPVVRG